MATRARTCIASIVLFSSAVAQAAPQPQPLQTLPADKLKPLAPLLRSNDLALIEAGDKGAFKQLTTMTWVAAPPAEVREAVAHPERYPQFVRNMKESTVKEEPGGTLWHQYAIGYTIYTVDGRHRYTFEKEAPEGGAPAVEMYDPDANGRRHYRWEFLPAGGGTLLVLYGFTIVPHDGFLSRFLNAAPTLEFGFALIPQMTLMLAMKQRAEQLSGKHAAPPPGASGSYDFLLERGTVALFRTASGRVSDISLIHRSTARTEQLLKVAAEPARWSSFIPTISRSTPISEGVELEQSLPLMTFTTRVAYRSDKQSVDMFGMSGDLGGGRLRWDVRPRPHGLSELVLRTMQRYDQGSLVIRQLYKLEPLFEWGIDVGLGLVLIEAVRTRAEQLDASHATR